MIVLNYRIKIDTAGYFLTLVPIGDEHFEGRTTNKNEILQLKTGIKEARQYFKSPLGFIKLGDEFEFSRKSFDDEMHKVGKASDRVGYEDAGRHMVNRIVDNYKDMVSPKDLKLAAVSGNHKINFTFGQKEYSELLEGKKPALNSSHLLANRLGFPYCGDGHALICIKCQIGRSTARAYKILILHGNGKGASPEADLKEFKKIVTMYGHIDMVIKAHSHKPMTTHFGRFNTDSMIDGVVSVQETTVINIGSMRGSMAMGHTDYGEKAEYAPIPTRWPMVALKWVSHSTYKGKGRGEIRAIPITF